MKFISLLLIVVGMENNVCVSLEPVEDGWNSGADPTDNNALTNHRYFLSRSSINNSRAVRVRPSRPQNSKYL